MPSSSCLQPKERRAEFSPLRHEKSDDCPENERRLDSLEGPPPQEPEKSKLERPQSVPIVGKTQALEQPEEVAQAKPSEDKKSANLHPCPDFKTSVFRLSSQDISPVNQGNASGISGNKRENDTEKRIKPFQHRQVFFPPDRPSTPPTATTPPPPPPARESSPEVTRVRFPFGTDWRTFFNYNEEDAGDAEEEFEDDDEEPFDFEALHRYLATVPDDGWDDDEDVEESDGYIADAEDQTDMRCRMKKRRMS